MPTISAAAAAAYDESERAALIRLAEILNGEIIALGGGFAAVRFGDHYDRPHTPENQGEPFDGWYLATINDLADWIVTYEHVGDDGQREWVQAEMPAYWMANNPEATADAVRAAGHAAAKGPLL